MTESKLEQRVGMDTRGKTFADECEELGEFRKSYMKKNKLKRLGMNEACQLWREHQGDIVAKDKLIVDSVNKAHRMEERIKELEGQVMGAFVEGYSKGLQVGRENQIGITCRDFWLKSKAKEILNTK